MPFPFNNRRGFHGARAAHKAGEMNRTEAAYSKRLDLQVEAEVYRAWYFERVKLTLAPGLQCTYTPDFMVVRADGVVEFHEVKGHWEDDARVKIKVAAAMYPFVFKAIKKAKGGVWEEETFTKEDNYESKPEAPGLCPRKVHAVAAPPARKSPGQMLPGFDLQPAEATDGQNRQHSNRRHKKTD